MNHRSNFECVNSSGTAFERQTIFRLDAYNDRRHATAPHRQV
ncbi:hypothetical protein [Stieleria neptunia]|nr:hypothetical protein [Stieleria neptunia]